jgi:hypothetical protein
VQRHDADAADRSGAGQHDPVGLGCQDIATRMMVSGYAARLRLTRASVAADTGGELEAALEVLSLIALRGMAVRAEALHCNRRPAYGSELAMRCCRIRRSGGHKVTARRSEESIVPWVAGAT